MTKTFHQPLGGNQMPRFGGPATMMRLPALPSAAGLDACFVGVPFDIGTSNRPGARFGPRQIRAESCLIRPYNMATRAAPFDSLSVADIGDVAINTFNIARSVAIIEAAYDGIVAAGCKPLSIGGDHTIALPMLRAVSAVHGPVAVVHFDAHLDTWDTYFGAVYTRRSCSTDAAPCRSGCAAPATPPRISTGRGPRASASCRPRNAGTARWRR